MPAFRALLLGVAEYDDPGIAPLPFVPRDIAELGVALEKAGYTVESRDGGRLSRPQILAEVTTFINGARRDDHLLIYLSGHGVHTEGADFLVPSETLLQVTPLRESLVDVTRWGGLIERSRATQVVFVIDACREGFDEQAMNVVDRRGWSTGRIERVGRQQVAYLFACGPGQKSRFVKSDDEMFSVFSRGLRQVITDGSAGPTLADLVEAVNEVTGELIRRHRLAAQQAHVRGGEPDRMPLFPPTLRSGGGTGSGQWIEQAAQHPVWQLLTDDPGAELLRHTTVELVRQLGLRRRDAADRLADDPWQDPGFAGRMSQRMEFLIGRVLTRSGTGEGPTTRFTPAEASLLVAAPFLYDTYWVERAAELAGVRPADRAAESTDSPERAEFLRFFQGYPRLSRRLAAQPDDPVTGQQIGWWLLHRWLRRRAPSFPLQAITDLLPVVVTGGPLPSKVFTPERLAELLHGLRTGPGFFNRQDRPGGLTDHRTVAAGSSWEQSVRERMVGYLLAVGHSMTIEVPALPEVVVEHLGIADPVRLDSLQATVRDAEWEPRGVTRVLRAACTHPAVELALRAHVGALDDLLVEIHQAMTTDGSLSALADLPAHASADQTGAAEGPDGREYQSAGVRFHLAEDRVQELLMGEQLYGDPGLAIRELYQNALDACRYRDARAEYLRRTGRPTPAWQGRITFTQGVDDSGRQYLDCVDNGIGMGVRELTEVFSQAGTRFADTPEFVEEQAEWARLDPPVELFPNSRFGIGVLSYFMLADEITVETCRYDRTGRPGDLLRVSIAGPGNLFRIRNAGPGQAPGTRIRLHLRPDGKAPSCVDLLRRILWVSEFHVEANSETDHHNWQPHELSSAAPLGADSPTATDIAVPARRTTVVADPVQHVWWCETDGAILVDGIWLRSVPWSAVIDLRGRYAPKLSVNRRQIISYRDHQADKHLCAAAEVVAAPGNPLLSHSWLARLVGYRPVAADLILDLALRAGWTSWPGEDGTTGLLTAGCFPPDETLRALPPSGWAETDSGYNNLHLFNLPALSDWRFAAWAAAGALGPQVVIETEDPVVVRAHPSDVVLLSADLSSSRPQEWLDPDRPVSLSRLVGTAAALRLPVGDVTRRLALLGYTLAAVPADIALTDDDTTLISRDLDAEAPWLDDSVPVPTMHILAASVRLDRSVGQVSRRLTELGYTVQHQLPDDLTITSTDTALISKDLDGQHPWLDPTQPVRAGHLLAASAATGRSAGHLVGRLALLGYHTDRQLPNRLVLRPTDRALLRALRNDGQWPEPGPTPFGLVVGASVTTGLPVREVVRRLNEIGYPTRHRLPGNLALTGTDATLISRDLDGTAPWLTGDGVVPPSHLLGASVVTRLTVGQITRRLTELGYTVQHQLPDGLTITGTDATLISKDLDGRTPAWEIAETMNAGRITRASAVTRLTVDQITRRLTELGYTVQHQLPDGLTITGTDATLISRNLDGRAPWLEAETPVGAGHVISAGAVTGLTVGQITRRLTELGYTARHHLPDHVTTDSSDQLLLNRNPSITTLRGGTTERFGRVRITDGMANVLDPGQPVPAGHLITAAAATGLTVGQTVRRLLELGYTVQHRLPDELRTSRADVKLVSKELGNGGPWLDPAQPVPAAHLIAAMNATGLTIDQLVRRFAELGYQASDTVDIPPGLGLPEGVRIRLR